MLPYPGKLGFKNVLSPLSSYRSKPSRLQVLLEVPKNFRNGCLAPLSFPYNYSQCLLPYCGGSSSVSALCLLKWHGGSNSRPWLMHFLFLLLQYRLGSSLELSQANAWSPISPAYLPKLSSYSFAYLFPNPVISFAVAVSTAFSLWVIFFGNHFSSLTEDNMIIFKNIPHIIHFHNLQFSLPIFLIRTSKSAPLKSSHW